MPRRAYVIDTNVLIVANKREGGTYACAAQCAAAILRVKESGAVVMDASGLILDEYASYLNYKGQPGLGDAFLRWFINNRGRRDLCLTVPLTSNSHEWRAFKEFPDNVRLKTFDRNDQKFVAAARAHGAAVILQASDHKWLNWATELETEGLLVEFLCREELEATRRGKKKGH